MEKKKIASVLAVLFLLAAGQILSPNRPSAAEMKIGVVDLQSALEKSESGKEAYKLLKTEYGEKQEAIKAKQEELRKLRAELDAKGGVLKDSVRREKEEDYQKMLRDLRRFISDANQEMQQKERDLSLKIISELVEVAKKIGEENGYQLIIEKREGVIHNAASINLTDEVIKRYDKGKKPQGK